MNKNLLVVMVVALAFVLGAGGLLAYRAARSNAEYAEIEAAVAAQRFADDLHGSRQTSYDCEARSNGDCQAIRYYVTADRCEEVVEDIIRPAGDADMECEATQANFSYDGDKYGAQLTKLDVGYELTVWSVN